MKLLLVGGTGMISYDATKLFIKKGYKVLNFLIKISA